MLKDRKKLITDLAMARLEIASREDLERIYVDTLSESMDQFSAADLVRWARNYGVDYELEPPEEE